MFMSCFMVINGSCSTNMCALCHAFKLNIVIEVYGNFCPHAKCTCLCRGTAVHNINPTQCCFSLWSRKSIISESVCHWLKCINFVLNTLLYGLEACPLRSSDNNSLDFVINRFFMKLFTTNNMETVTYCRMQFNFDLPSTILKKKKWCFC